MESRNEIRGGACDHVPVDRGIDGAPPEESIRLAIVDDHPAIAQAIAAATSVSQHGDERAIRVVGSARTPEAGIELVRRSGPDAPDVVLSDLQLREGADGLRVIAAAAEAGCRPIVLTSFDRASLMRAAFERGASGFLDKGTEVEAILAAVRAVAAGGTAFSGAALDAARFAPRAPSDREISVLVEVHRGATSEEIGARLGISARTVESHLRRLFDRYGVVSRTELAVLALREGWIEGGPP